MPNAASPQLDPDDPDVRNLLNKLGSNWGWFLAFGLVSVAVGILMLIWPGITVLVMAIVLGAWLLVSGVFALVTSFSARDEDTTSRVMMGIVGALSILLGLLAFRGAFQAVEILALFVGIGWLFRGITDLIVGIGAKGQAGRGLTIFVGVLGMIAGGVVLLWPAITLLALAIVAGVWLIIMGIVWIFGAFAIRSEAKKLQQQG